MSFDPDTDCCARCDHDLSEAVVRWLEDGGIQECPRCGCEFPVPDDAWLVSNGYEPMDANEEDGEDADYWGRDEEVVQPRGYPISPYHFGPRHCGLFDSYVEGS